MERYSEYKDSGEQWLGEIPSHWEARKMKYIFRERSEKGYPNEPLLAATQNHGVICKSSYENRTVEASKGLDTLKLVEKGDFVISLRSFQGGLEYAYDRGIISPAYTILQPIHILSDYFKYLAKSTIYISLLRSVVTGIREGQNIDYSKLKEYLLQIPPQDEQVMIGKHLDRVTSQLDEAIAQQRRMIDLLNERKQIIIQHAVTKGLDPNAEMVESGVEWIGMMPKGWKCMPLKRCCSLIRTKASNNQVNRISLENIVSWKGSFAKTDSIYEGNGILYKKGDILFGKLRPYLAKVLLAESEGEALGDFWVMRPNDFVLPNYVKFIFLCYSLIELIDSTTYGAKMPRADWNANSKTLIPIPPIAVQHKICEYIDQMIDYTNSVISKNEHRISLLRERKQIIINEVVTGKVRVS